MSWKNVVLSWFYFSRKERLGIYIVCFLILAMWALPTFFTTDSDPIPKLNFTAVQVDSLEHVLIKREQLRFNRLNAEKRHFGKSNYSSNETKEYVRARTMLDLNLADSAALEHLPGIGEKLSSRIIKYRDRLGGFIRIDQLQEIYGLTDSNYIKCKDFVLVKEGFIPEKIHVNRADYSMLRKHPYINNLFAKSLLAYVKAHGTIASSDELFTIGSIEKETAKKVLPYLDFSR